MKIDTHTHIWDNLDFSDEVKRYTPTYLFTQKSLERIMNKHNIKKVVLVQPSFLGNDNSLLIETVKSNLAKYRGVIVLDDFDTYLNLNDTLSDYDKLGIKGIRLNLIGKVLPNFNEEKYQKLFSILIHLKWHLEIHANEQDIYNLLKDFKDVNLKIVLDHFGRPQYNEYSNDFKTLLKSELDLYIKVSANYRFKNFKIDNFINTLLLSLGKRKLLWGSDCPFTRFEDTWKYQDSLDLLMKNKLTYNLNEVLDDNAKEVFDWK